MVKKEKIVVPSTPLVPERVDEIKKPSLCETCLKNQKEYQDASRVANSKKLLKKSAKHLHDVGQLDLLIYNRIGKIN